MDAKPESPVHKRILQAFVEDDLSDIECHADEWFLPSPVTDDGELPAGAQKAIGSSNHAASPYECTQPSPLMHAIDEAPE